MIRVFIGRIWGYISRASWLPVAGFFYRERRRTVMVIDTISPSFFEGMHMNKVLVAGILGLMLTACGQKEEAAAPAATPAADVAATVSEAASTVEKAASEASATVEKAAADVATKAEAAVSDAKAN